MVLAAVKEKHGDSKIGKQYRAAVDLIRIKFPEKMLVPFEQKEDTK